MGRRTGLTRGLLILLATAACDRDEITAVHPLWSADRSSLDNPLPDVRLYAREGGIQLRPNALLPFTPLSVRTPELVSFFDRYAVHAGAIEGWGAYASCYLRFSGPIDADSLKPGSVAIAGIDPDVEPLPPIDLFWREDPGFLEIRPRHPLVSDARYALVVTKKLRGRGAAVIRPPEFILDERLTERAVATLNIEPEEIVLASEFHTQSALEDTLSLAASIDSTYQDPPYALNTYTPQTFRAQFPEQNIDLEAASLIGAGEFESLEFRTGGVIDARSEGSKTRLEFVIVEPLSDLFPPPWPLVIVQHGFNGSKSFALERSGEFTRRGFAVIGIDAAGHGSRGNALQFINLEDVRKLRDAFRQTALDLVQLERFAETLDLDGVEGPDFQKPARFFGHSFGAITGGLFVSLKPEGRVAVLNAGGGAFREIFEAESLEAGVAILLRGAVGLDLDDPGYEQVRPIIYNMAQVIFEPADPVVYGHLAKDRARVLLQQGAGDRLVPNKASALLAAEMGLPLRTDAIRDPNGAGGYWSIDPKAFGIPESQDPHGVYFLIDGVRDQAVEYLWSRGTHIPSVAP